MQIISLSDALHISNLAFLSEVQKSLTELLLFVSDQEPSATDITEILSLNNKLYSGSSSGMVKNMIQLEYCIISSGKTYTDISTTDILAGKKLVRERFKSTSEIN